MVEPLIADAVLPGSRQPVHPHDITPPLRVVSERGEGSATWRAHFHALRDFAESRGHCRVPYRELVGGLQLYAWAARQRAHRSDLSNVQVHQLEALPGWSWNFRESDWQASFRNLLSFVEREGHCIVPRSHIENGEAIGRWVGAQRQRLPTMTAEHRQLLESLPGWADNARAERWWQMRALVARFALVNGHSRVPYNCDVDGTRLGTWVARQRLTYRRERLSAERIQALESLPGWSWAPSADDRHQRKVTSW